MGSVIEDGLKILGLNHDILKALDVYLGELRLFNKSLKLVGDPEEQWPTRHILDSLAPLPILAQKAFVSVADLGSGAGLPGLLMALFFPDCQFTLIERMGSRCAFLQNAVAMMKLRNVEIRESDLENVKEKFDLVVMRAFLPLKKIEEDLLRLGKGGRIAAWKGRRQMIEEELMTLKKLPKPEKVESYTVPFLSEERNLVIFEIK